MNMDKERFKNIVLNEIEFTVGCQGSIFRNGKLLKQNENHDGYLVVYIGNNRGKGVHRLVAKAFINNNDPKKNLEVNHKDFNRKNNSADNLEWVSRQDNIEYSRINGRYPKSYGKDNPNYGNRKLSKFYSENPDIAKEKQSRKGSQNGMAKPIAMYKDEVKIKNFAYIGKCCEYLHQEYGFSSNLESVRCGINKSLREGKPYKGFSFKV